MAISVLHHSDIDNNKTLVWAIVLSITLHTILVTQLPKWHFDNKPQHDDVITIELAQPKKPEPVIEKLPEPLKPEPVKPQIQPRHVEQPIVQKTPVPQPLVPAPSKPVSNEPPPPPAVIAVAPKAEAAPPAFVAPVPEPAKPSGPSEQDVESARNLYRGMLEHEIIKHKQYPKIAMMRGWQGEVMLELQIDDNGNLVSSKVLESSGYEALDKQALEMVKKAQFPSRPDALRGRAINVHVPIPFRLES